MPTIVPPRTVVPDHHDYLVWDAAKRARRGARLLDEAQPDWFYGIKPDSLSINNPYRCVLNTIYGSYGHGLTVLDLEHPFNYGFCGDHDGVLREAWIDEIAVRVAMAGPRPVRWYQRVWDALGRVSDLAA